MGHPIPKELKGEERFFTIPFANIYFNKKGIIYNGGVTGFSAIMGKLTGNGWVFGVLFVILNLIAYPLAHMKMPKRKFDGGNVGLDVYAYRMIKYKFFTKGNLYIRKRGE